MKKLTPEFVKKQGFILTKRVDEDEFSWESYEIKSPLLSVHIIVFFNYYSDGSITYEVTAFGEELQNMGEEELLMLLRVIPKE